MELYNKGAALFCAFTILPGNLFRQMLRVSVYCREKEGYLYGKTVNTSAVITGADKVKSSVFSKMGEFTIPIRYAIIEWNAAENTVLKDIQQFEQRCSSFKMV